VVAYSTEGVRRHFQSLLTTIDAERRDHANDLSEIRRAHESVDAVVARIGALDISKIGTQEDTDLWELLKSCVKRSAEAEEHMADNCDLDIDALAQACQSVIAEARKDLRGPA